jgi:hypothetical protein
VEECHDYKKNEQGYMKNVPESEETLANGKSRGVLGSADTLRHKVSHAGELPAPNLLRPPAALAFDRDHPPRVGDQPHAKGGSAPANHG